MNDAHRLREPVEAELAPTQVDANLQPSPQVAPMKIEPSALDKLLDYPHRFKMPQPDQTNGYLDLIKRVLINHIYPEADNNIAGNPPGIGPYSLLDRMEGLAWPKYAHTMTGWYRLCNLEECLCDCIAGNVPGDFIETGVWRGGASILAAAIFKHWTSINDDPGLLGFEQASNRCVWACDSFCGFRSADSTGLDLSPYPQLYVTMKEVADNFAKYGLLDEKVKLIKGYFCDTLPNLPIKKIAVLRLDGDYYQSTMDSLTNLYHKVSPGGYIIIDDYALDACKWAVDKFRQDNKITEELQRADHTGYYWQVRR